MKESKIQRDILNMLLAHPKVAIAWTTTTGRVRGSSGRYYTLGYPGLSDIIGMLKGGKLFAIEVKTDSGKLSDEQIRFLADVQAGGGISMMARSVEDALNKLEDLDV